MLLGLRSHRTCGRSRYLCGEDGYVCLSRSSFSAVCVGRHLHREQNGRVSSHFILRAVSAVSVRIPSWIPYSNIVLVSADSPSRGEGGRKPTHSYVTALASLTW